MKITDVAIGVEAKSSSDLFEIGNRSSGDEELAGFLRSDSLVSRNSGDPFVSMMKAADLWDRHNPSS